MCCKLGFLALGLALAFFNTQLSAQENSHTVTVDPMTNGSIELQPPLPEDGKYEDGTVITVRATPSEGFAVDSIYYSVPGRWGAMYHESLTSTFEITIDQVKHIGASFIDAERVENLNVKHNVVYAKPGKKELKYDVYSPKDKQNLPIIVIIHGGGWSTNDEDIMRGLARELTKESQFVVCSIDYRWIGDSDGDDQPNSMANLIEDVFGAIAHIMEHATEYGGDASRLGVTGDSAGGHLSASAAVLTEMIGSRGFGKEEGVYEFMPTYLPEGKSANEVRDEMLQAIKAAAPESHVPDSKVRAVPHYLTRGSNDSLIRSEAVASYVEALNEKNQIVIYDEVEGAGHAFFDWKPNDQVKETFAKFGVPYADKMRLFFAKHLSE